MVKPGRKQLEQLNERLQAFGRLYAFRDPNNACLFGLRVNECYVLDYLVETGAVSVSNLAGILGIHKSNASRIAAALQDQGLIEQYTNTDDKRAVILKPTARGVRKQAEVKKHLVARLQKTLSGFSRDDLNVAMKVFEGLTIDAKERMVAPSDC